MINNNPFSINRAEYMKNLWKYYVPFKDFPDNVDKSIIVVGGRGTGKSMFFLCNSWKEKYASLSETSEAPINDLLGQKQIGIYYKVDSTFVGAMNLLSQEQPQWQGYFNTYLSISLLIDLLPLIRILHENCIINSNSLDRIVSTYYRTTRQQYNQSAKFDDIKDDCLYVLQEIEDLINGVPNDNISFRSTQPGTIFKSIIDEIQKNVRLSDVVFKVYIDEYESFSEWQQKIINTLIKQSNHLLIYNVGMRHNGMKTICTLGENEILQSTHDYYYFNFDDLLSGKDYINSLRTICKKRFEMFFSTLNLNVSPSTDIEDYLSLYNVSDEFERLSKRKFKFKSFLKSTINEQCTSPDQKIYAVDLLCENAPIANARLHLALLLRSTQFRPTISELCQAYQSWKDNAKDEFSKKYSDWWHNAQNGLVFLLARESGTSKWYYGFDTFVSLSSGVIRYFLELCEQTFNIAMLEGFNWGDPKPISPEIQTRAAKYVSQYKVNEISSYPICGKRLRIFIQCFGEICRDLHYNERLTLGEPEINHFTTNSLQLSPEIEKYLDEAVTYLVLQKLPQTKSKETLRKSIVDYHLNKIYTPYFGISYYKKRKIILEEAQLEQLLSANLDTANHAAHDFLEKYWSNKNKLNKTVAPHGTTSQLSIFGEGNYDN